MSGMSKSCGQPSISQNLKDESSSVNGGSILCDCGEEAVVRISRTAWNPGKPWYGCYLPKNHARNCDFFLWVGNEAKYFETKLKMMKNVGQAGCWKDGDSMTFNEFVVKNANKNEEMKLLKRLMVKNEDVIDEVRMVKEVIMQKNDIVSAELKLLRGCVLGLVVVIIIGFIVLLLRA